MDFDSEDEENCLKSFKNRKRKNYFNKTWSNDHDWLFQGKQIHFAKCILCGSEFSIKNGGITDVKRHMNTKKHKCNIKLSAQNNLRKFFHNTSSTSIPKNVKQKAAAEATFIFHTIQHAHSYNSANCSGNLFPVIFPDSQIALKFSCGRTKLSKIVTNVLDKTTQTNIKLNLQNNRSFSIATDASNKGNIKMFPLIIRYFCKEDGVQTKLLNLFESPTEKSTDIAVALVSKIKNFEMDTKNIIAYCGDNANVNFGSNQSVYTELKKNNPELIDIGCCCHVLHNAIKKASTCLKYDLEILVLKIYNEFSCHTKRKQHLMEFYTFCDV